MIPSIQDIKANDNYLLQVLLDDGKQVLYDLKQTIAQIEDFKQLETLEGLWNNFQLDKSRTCVFGNNRID